MTYRMLKESTRGYGLLFDSRMVHFTLNSHLIPNGPIDISQPYKNSRLISDTAKLP
jgi:hypothetical protein